MTSDAGQQLEISDNTIENDEWYKRLLHIAKIYLS